MGAQQQAGVHLRLWRLLQLFGQALCMGRLRAVGFLGQGSHDAADGVLAAAQVGLDGPAHRVQQDTRRVHLPQRLDAPHVLRDDVRRRRACTAQSGMSSRPGPP